MKRHQSRETRGVPLGMHRMNPEYLIPRQADILPKRKSQTKKKTKRNTMGTKAIRSDPTCGESDGRPGCGT